MENFREYLERNWESNFKGVGEILENLEKTLKEKGYRVTTENYHPFDFEKANKSYYPNVRVDDVIMVVKSQENDFIGVSSLGKFPLMGEKHTYESFIKKLTE